MNSFNSIFKYIWSFTSRPGLVVLLFVIPTELFLTNFYGLGELNLEGLSDSENQSICFPLSDDFQAAQNSSYELIPLSNNGGLSGRFFG